jgi:thioredoxin reductase
VFEGGRSWPQVDIVVIGGGPAGLSAAATAAGSGASVLVLEASRDFGGLLGGQPQPLRDRLDFYEGLAGRAYATTLQEHAMAAGARLVSDAPVFDVARDLEPDITVSFTHGDAAEQVRARRLIVATGSTDGVSPFPGWTLPGVVLAREARSGLTRVTRAIVVGGGDEALIAAMNLRNAGAGEVTVVYGPPELTASEDVLKEATAAGVRLEPGHVILDAAGSDRVEKVTLGGCHGTQELSVDCVVIATHRAPEFRVASLLGVKAAYEHDLGGWVPAIDDFFRTTDGAVLVAGDASGIENGAVAIAVGNLAGLHAAQDLGMHHPEADAITTEATEMIAVRRRGRRGEARAAARLRVTSPEGAQAPMAEAPLANSGLADSALACRCTGATLGDVRAAVGPGNASAPGVRRLSRAGMGICQGRYCDDVVALVIAEQTGRPVAAAGRPRTRSPVCPVTLSALAKLDGSGQDAVLE